MKNAVLLGLFDSVHMGHLQAVKALCDTGAENKTVYTFKLATHTAKGDRIPLISDEEKAGLLIEAGATRVVSVAFESVRSLTPEEFVENILIGELEADVVLAGENFRFGRFASGDMDTLKKLCNGRGAEVISVPLARDSEGVISTTRIRALLEAGEVEKANSLLGRRYSVSGRITHGNALGRQWGIKTLNLPYEGCLRCGVYSTLTCIENESYKSVTNIGFKPTVTDGKIKNCETHLLDFDKEVYGEEARIELLSFYRSEEKFPDSHSLTEAIKNDITKRREENE